LFDELFFWGIMMVHFNYLQ